MHYSTRRGLSLALLVLILLSGLAVGRPAAVAAASDRPVMAFYYPWWELSDWSYDRMSDLPASRYSSGDDAVLRRHIQQADDAGIDALICAWFGPNEERLNARCRRLMDLIEESGRDLQVAIMPEQAAWASLNSVPALTDALNTLKRDWMGRSSYFRFQGRPVVFWFRPESLGNTDTWIQLRDAVDRERAQYWFIGTDNFDYLRASDALYFFDITWERSPGAAMASYTTNLNNWNRSNNQSRPLIATVMPGYDDIKVRNGHRRDRENGNYYVGTWTTAIERSAAAVVITSFNEFFEGSHIEPSEQFGDLYLRLTREQIERFRTTTPVAPGARCRDFPETRQRVCDPILSYWENNGGLPVFGYPITALRTETIEGSWTGPTQWFERDRLEDHSNQGQGVLAGRLGAQVLQLRGTAWESLPKVSSAPAGCRYFAETGHSLCEPFLSYWQNNGGLPRFGYPISEPLQEQIGSWSGTVQYFERRRMEHHLENRGSAFEVLLGLLGRDVSGIR